MSLGHMYTHFYYRPFMCYVFRNRYKIANEYKLYRSPAQNNELFLERATKLLQDSPSPIAWESNITITSNEKRSEFTGP